VMITTFRLGELVDIHYLGQICKAGLDSNPLLDGEQ